MRPLLAAAIILLTPTPASAHHSAAVTYDGMKTSTVRGVVAQVIWINPHIEIEIEGRGQDHWVFETRPPGFFVREGLSKSDLENLVGHEATLTMHPARDGSKRGWLLTMNTDNGMVLTLPDS